MRKTDWGHQLWVLRGSASLKSVGPRRHPYFQSVIQNSLEGSARTRKFDICCGWGIADSIYAQKFRKGRVDNFLRSGQDVPESQRAQPLHYLQRSLKNRFFVLPFLTSPRSRSALKRSRKPSKARILSRSSVAGRRSAERCSSQPSSKVFR